MRQRLNPIFVIFFFVLPVLAVHACSLKHQQDGYKVVFESRPDLHDPEILYKGTPVGIVKASTVGGFQVTKVVVELKEEFVREMGNNLVFLVRNGRLEAAKLGTYGHPLDKDTPLCGFNSPLDLTWFKIKTLMRNRISAAQKRARYLNERFSVQTPS